MTEEFASPIPVLLAPDEKLLWAGRPKQGFVYQLIDVFAVAFGLAHLIIVAIPLIQVMMGTIPVFIAFATLPMYLSPAYFLFGRSWLDAKRRNHISYAVTTQRVIILSGIFRRSSNSLDLCTLSDVSLVEYIDGSGSISFGQNQDWINQIVFKLFYPSPFVPTFEMIQAPRQVYDLIRATRAAAKSEVGPSISSDQ